MSEETDYRLGTRCLHAGHDVDETGARGVPIHASTSFLFRDTRHAADLFALRELGNIYSRLMNPTVDVLERRLAALDGGGAGLGFASGMAAITAVVCTLTGRGQNIVSSASLYGGTVTLFSQTLKRFGIEVRYFDTDQPEKIGELADENTRLVYVESQGNPRNDVPDFEKIAEIAHGLGVPLVVDNTVMTPALFRPLDHGADVVVYSTTKYIGGHGVHVGGAVVDGGRFDWSADPDRWAVFCAPDDAYHGVVFQDLGRQMGNIALALHMRTHWLRDTGGCMSPYAAQLFLLGLETLHLRMPRHCQNAQAVAEFLAGHPAVSWVNYPGLPDHPHYATARRYMPDGHGGILGFEVVGGVDAGVRFINGVRLASHLANIGDAKTLVIHPASTTHQQLTEAEQQSAGVTPGYIRLSVGIEDVEDIIADLDQALRASQS